MSATSPVASPEIMGVVNVTPDSFSDGGLFLEAGRAIEHGRKLAAEGADWVDIGGESTRPTRSATAPSRWSGRSRRMGSASR